MLLLALSALASGPPRVILPQPRRAGRVAVEEALQRRRSVREFAEGPLSLQEVSQLLWSAQGTTDPRGLRSAPSAGALYPLEVYLVTGEVLGLRRGVYRYEPGRHGLVLLRKGDQRGELCRAALGQPWVEKGAAILVITAVYDRTTRKYGKRGRRYVHMEAGAVAQSVYLQATALGLGTVAVGAFHDDRVRQALGLPPERQPLLLMPVGRLP